MQYADNSCKLNVFSEMIQAVSDSPITYRPLEEPDLGALKHLHDTLFPIDYQASFFTKAVQNDGIIGLAAIRAASDTQPFPDATTVFVGNEQLVGFITAREIAIRDVPVTDQRLLRLDQYQEDSKTIMYILTLGVANAYRRQGIAHKLLEYVEIRAQKAGCIALYLHVITYNNAAKHFYEKSGFSCIAELKDFYHIPTGRALHTDIKNYDAYVFKKMMLCPNTIREEDNIIFEPAIQSPVHTTTMSLRDLWDNFIKVCLPFGTYNRKTSSPYKPTHGGAPAPSWLKGLFWHAQGNNGDNHIA